MISKIVQWSNSLLGSDGTSGLCILLLSPLVESDCDESCAGGADVDVSTSGVGILLLTCVIKHGLEEGANFDFV